jgi:hypothetical protein
MTTKRTMMLGAVLGLLVAEPVLASDASVDRAAALERIHGRSADATSIVAGDEPAAEAPRGSEACPCCANHGAAAPGHPRA